MIHFFSFSGIRISLRLGLLFPAFFLLCGLPHVIFADITNLNAKLIHNGESVTAIYQNDHGISLQGVAGHCVDTRFPSQREPGNAYMFVFKIIGPNSTEPIKTFTYPTGINEDPNHSTIQTLINKRAELPNGANATSDIKQTIFITPAQFYSVPSSAYQISVTFYQKWKGTSPLFSTSKTVNFQMLPGNRPGSGSINQINLIRPGVSVDNLSGAQVSRINTLLPVFEWSNTLADRTYKVYLGLTNPPHQNPFWQSKEITISSGHDLRKQYPPEATSLVPGETYYWMLREVPEGGVAVIGSDSGVYVFSVLGTIQTNDIQLTKPIDQQKIQTSMPTFRWTSALPLNSSYTFHLKQGDDIIHTHTIVHDDQDAQLFYQYNYANSGGGSIPFEKAQDYSWYITGSRAGEMETAKRSSSHSFAYAPVESASTSANAAGATTLAVCVLSSRNSSVRGALVQLQKQNSEISVDQYVISRTTQDDGCFQVTDVESGQYIISAEVNYVNFSDYLRQEASVAEGISNRINLVMSQQGDYIITFSGKQLDDAEIPIRGVRVKFIDSNNHEYEFSSDEEGKCRVTVRPGRYNVSYRLENYIPQNHQIAVSRAQSDENVVLNSVPGGGLKVLLKQRGISINLPLSGVTLSGDLKTD